MNLAIADYTQAIKLKSDYGQVYYDRAITWLHQQEWEKARADFIDAKDRGIDIIALFRNDYQNMPDFETQMGLNFPEDIASMLTEPNEQIDQTLIKMRNLFQPQNRIENYRFETFEEVLGQLKRANSIRPDKPIPTSKWNGISPNPKLGSKTG